MIDSTNPRIIADNIRNLESEIEGITPGTVVTANPEGEASGTLNSIGIGDSKYLIPVYTPVSYSTSEVDTGISWIDGKEVYMKVVPIAALPSTAFTPTNYAHSISDIDTIVDYQGIFRWSSGQIAKETRIAFSNNTVDPISCMDIEVDKTNVIITTGTDRSSMSADVIIYYTKTASEAKSKRNKK